MNARFRIGLARRRAAKEARGVLVRLGRRSSLADRSSYRDACEEAVTNDEIFARFKRDPQYRRVLEHVTPEQGGAYLKLALERAPSLELLLDSVRGNDALGSPELHDYDGYGSFSPTTLRYFKVLADLQMLFGSLDGFDIIEIGGGYGGQAFVCSQAASLGSYTLVDLPEAAALQEKYLARLGVEGFHAVTSDSLDAAEYDLVISNYAFSELTRPVQRMYLERVLQHSKRGYITVNHRAPRAYRQYTVPELLDALPGSWVLPIAEETALDRKADVDILVWGAAR